MITLSKKLTIATILLVVSQFSQAFYNQTLSGVRTHQADNQTRNQILSVLESCGVPNDGVEPECVLQGLQGPYNNIKDPSMAANIVDGYQAVLNDKVNDPKCQLPAIYIVNQAAALCVLVLHYAVLEASDPAVAKIAFDRCLVSKIGGLAFAGNIAAQFSMKKIAEQSGRGEQVQVWTNTLRNNNDPRDIEEMAHCF